MAKPSNGQGAELLKRLGNDLTARFGRGFSKRNLEQMRGFYAGWEIAQTTSAQFEARVRLPPELLESEAEIFPAAPGSLSIAQTPSAKFGGHLITAFPPVQRQG